MSSPYAAGAAPAFLPSVEAAARPRIVALGGGTGLPVVLRGLKASLASAAADRGQLTAIVTVADDGGSSGRLRRAYGMLAPGDVRNCLLALSDGGGTLSHLFGYRFNGHSEISGHSLGNLILAALSQMESGFERAVEAAGEILGASGRVLPATADEVGLEAEFEDGTRVAGESRIGAAGARIRRIRLQPAASVLPQALDAIRRADCVVIGPGSLYTSLVPVLLTGGLVEAVAASGARVVVVMNLMSEPGETDGYTAADHLAALQAHAPSLPIHDVIVNATPLAEPVRRLYAERGAEPVAAEPAALAALAALGCRVSVADLLAPGPRVLHDACKLARAILDLAARPLATEPA